MLCCDVHADAAPPAAVLADVLAETAGQLARLADTIADLSRVVTDHDARLLELEGDPWPMN